MARRCWTPFGGLWGRGKKSSRILPAVDGLGVGSEFSWNVQGGVGYEVADWFSLVAEYKALWVDFNNEKTGLDFFSYDMMTHGPAIALAFQF